MRSGRLPFEVLMVERNARGMFASLFVFPGGTVEEGDADLRHTALRELAEETGLEIDDVDRLTLVSRWLTPRFAPKRFDTMFYLLDLSEAGEVEVDGSEVVSYAWVTPAEALGLASDGTWGMILPTLSHLRWLARRTSIADAFSSAEGADGSTLIEPSRTDDGSLFPIHFPAEN